MLKDIIIARMPIGVVDYAFKIRCDYRESDAFKEDDEHCCILTWILSATLAMFLACNEAQVLIDACDKTLKILSHINKIQSSVGSPLSSENQKSTQHVIVEYSKSISNLKSIAHRICSTSYTTNFEDMTLIDDFLSARLATLYYLANGSSDLTNNG